MQTETLRRNYRHGLPIQTEIKTPIQTEFKQKPSDRNINMPPPNADRMKAETLRQKHRHGLPIQDCMQTELLRHKYRHGPPIQTE